MRSLWSTIGARVRARPVQVAIATLFVVLKIVYLVRALQPGANDGLHVILGSDSGTYVTGAGLSIFSKAFYEAPGPFGFLVLFKLVARNVRALVIAQTLISIAAWIGLALSVQSAMRTNVAKLVGFAGVIATGLAPAFVMYDVAVATESLAISLGCVVLALAVRLAVRADRLTIIAFVVAFAAAAFTHDADALLAGGVGVVALLALAVPRWRAAHMRQLLVVGIVLVVVGGVETELSNAARRWYWPTAETLTYRVAGTPAGYKWLVAHGMPNDGSVHLLQSQGYFLAYQGFQNDDPPYHALRHWLDVKGRSTYTRYLLTHPGYVLFEPRHSLADQFTPNVAALATAQHIRPDPVIRAIGAVGLPGFRITMGWALLAMLALVWALWAERGKWPEHRRIGYTILFMAVIVIPHALAVFHGDVFELGRHSISVALQARVVVWAATAFALDAVLLRRRSAQ